MLSEGFFDGDGALYEHDFRILMIRLNPSFIVEAEKSFPIGINAEINGGGLHETDLLPPTANRFKNPRSSLDLPDPEINRRKQQNPRDLEPLSNTETDE